LLELIKNNRRLSLIRIQAAFAYLNAMALHVDSLDFHRPQTLILLTIK